MRWESILERVGIGRRQKTTHEITEAQWVRTHVPARQAEAQRLFRYWTSEFDTKLREPTGKIEVVLNGDDQNVLRDEAFIAALEARMTLKTGVYGDWVKREDLMSARKNRKKLTVQIFPNFMTSYPEDW